MSLIQVVKNYVTKMITESEPGYKIMLMDKETVSKQLTFDVVLSNAVIGDYLGLYLDSLEVHFFFFFFCKT